MKDFLIIMWLVIIGWYLATITRLLQPIPPVEVNKIVPISKWLPETQEGHKIETFTYYSDEGDGEQGHTCYVLDGKSISCVNRKD